MRPGFCLCIARDCKVTGRPRFEDREFICTTHVARADERDIAAHANAAAALIAAEAAEKRGRGMDRAMRARAREGYAWRRIVDQVVERCGRRPVEPIQSDSEIGA